MDREAFEQLVSEWLDQPERADLRARIEAAVVESPAFGRVRDEWLRFDRLIRGAGLHTGRVDWPHFRLRIAERLESAHGDAALDERLRTLTAVERRVDWPHLRRRISAVLAGVDGGRAAPRIPLRRLGAGLALLATAAALVLMFALPSRSTVAPPAFARVEVSMAAGALATADSERGFARVSVSALPEADEALEQKPPPGRGASAPRLAEVFLMVEPARSATDAPVLLSPFDFN
jgi:hypothetical protein